MSLSASLAIGSTAVRTAQLALQVVGNNIANAGTAGFIREETNFTTIPNTQFGTLPIGNGVYLNGINQKVDRLLVERARQAESQYQAANTQTKYFQRLESQLNELSDQDLSTALNQFYQSVQDVANDPENVSLRSIALQQGLDITQTIRDFRSKIDQISQDISNDVESSVDEINQTVLAVRKLNNAIVEAEAASQSDAGNLRVERSQQLDKLANLIPIQVHEQPNGSVNVLTDGDFLLFNNSVHEVGALASAENGASVTRLVFADSQTVIDRTGGKIGGAQLFRDEAIDPLVQKLDALSQTVIFEFNKLHSSGQGLESFTQVEGSYFTLDSTIPLNSPDTGMTFLPKNGSFEISVEDGATGLKQTYTIDVDLDGIGTDDSLDDVINRINTVAYGGLPVASINAQGHVEIQAPGNTKFSFANDTSGFLAAFGINTFFTGTEARNIGVNSDLISNPKLFAASLNGSPGDNSNALRLANFGSQSFDSLGGESTDEYYSTMVGELATSSQSASIQAAVLKTSKTSLQAENLAISGVSLDEEAIKLVSFQRSFQAAARYISTINDLMDEVLSLGR